MTWPRFRLPVSDFQQTPVSGGVEIESMLPSDHLTTRPLKPCAIQPIIAKDDVIHKTGST